MSFAAAVVARTSTRRSSGSTCSRTPRSCVTGLQAALVTQPHNVLGTQREGAEYARYTTTTAVVQLAFAGATTLVALVAALAAALAEWEHADALFALVAANVGWQLLAFTRRVLYTEGRTGRALATSPPSRRSSPRTGSRASRRSSLSD